MTITIPVFREIWSGEWSPYATSGWIAAYVAGASAWVVVLAVFGWWVITALVAFQALAVAGTVSALRETSKFGDDR